MKKIITIIMSVILLISVVPITAKVTEKKEGPSKEFLINQEKSLNEYDKMIKEMEKDSEKLKKEGKISPDYYGGCFVDDEGYLVINLKDDSKEIKNNFKDKTKNKDLKFNKVKHSENEIVDMIYHVCSLEDELMKQGVDIVSVKDDLVNNQVIVEIYEINQQKIDVAKKIVKSDMVTFINGVKSQKESSTLKGGMEIHEYGDSNGTLSFCATRTYYIGGGVYGTQTGFVTAGHVADTVGARTILNSNNDFMGTTRVTYENYHVDAAFVESDSDVTLTDDVSYLSITGTGSKPVGTWVTSYGKNNVSTGKILAIYASNEFPDPAYIRMYNLVETDYHAEGGDSGAPIMYGSTLLGIHVGGQSAEYYCKISVVNSYLGTTVY